MEIPRAVSLKPFADDRRKEVNIMRLEKLIIVGVILLLFTSCSPLLKKDSKILKLKGSDTMLFLANEWAAEYMETHPGISVYVEGGGSSTGFSGLVDGTIDIALASRLIRSREASELAARYNTIGMSFLVAKDGLSIFLNNENPVSNLSIDELRKIFSGEIQNWNQVGGADAEIEVVIRPPSSGTQVYLNEFVLENQPSADKTKILHTTAEIVEYIEQNKNAVSFGGIAYGRHIKHCSINGVPATEENVRSGTYPLIRYLYVYTVTTPSGLAKNFIDWLMSPAGQRIVEKVGYIPLWSFD